MSFPKIVFLDYDLTLVDTLLDFYEAVNEARAFFNSKPYTLDEFYRLFYSDRIGVEAIPDNTSPSSFWRFFRRVYKTRHGSPAVGACYLLLMLRLWGSRNIIVTGREVLPETIWDELRRFNLDWGVDEVYTMYSLWRLGGVEAELFDKSWILKHIIRRYGVEAFETVMIGDYKLDARSCIRAGIPFIGVSNIDKRRRDLVENGACIVVKNLYEVPLAIHKLFYSREEGLTYL